MYVRSAAACVAWEHGKELNIDMNRVGGRARDGDTHLISNEMNTLNPVPEFCAAV